MATTYKKVAVTYSGDARVLRSILGLAVGSGRTVYVPSVTIDPGRDRAFAYGVVVKSQVTNEVLWDGPVEYTKLTAPTPAVEADQPPPPAAPTPAPTEAPAEPAGAAEPREDAAEKSEDVVEAAQSTLLTAFAELNSGKAQAFIKKIESLDDLAEIDAWERENKRRSTVFNAVAQRLSELEPTE